MHEHPELFNFLKIILIYAAVSGCVTAYTNLSLFSSDICTYSKYVVIYWALRNVKMLLSTQQYSGRTDPAVVLCC